jgi:hypothetical protein
MGLLQQSNVSDYFRYLQAHQITLQLDPRVTLQANANYSLWPYVNFLTAMD